MGKRHLVLGIALILIGGAGVFLLSAGVGWGPDPGWAPGMMGPGMMGDGPAGRHAKQTFASNGEGIYYTGVSAKTGPIPRAGGPIWVRLGGLGCAACHGVRGRGGVPGMMGTAISADIRYDALITGEYEQG